MSISIRQDSPNQLPSLAALSQETPPQKNSLGATDLTTASPSHSKASLGFSFGDMTTTNIASALGVEETQHTMSYQTKMVQEECSLQEKLASMLGGAGGSSSASPTTGGGLYGMELNMQVSSATNAETALENAGEGLMNAGFASIGSTALCLGGVGASVGNFKPNAEMTTELENAKEFQTNFNKADELEAPDVEDNVLAREGDVEANQEASSQTALTDKENEEVDDMIKNWKGSHDRDYNISSYKKGASVEQQRLQEKAIQKLKTNATDRDIVKNNIEDKISQLKSKISLKQTERLNIVTQIVGQAGNSASSLAQGQGQQAQATATGASQTESAEGQYFEKMIQSYDQQMRNLQQMAGSFSGAADSTAQQMAFQG